ncbi:MAG TPA: TetR family transcriptional regulator [Bryobacteraceae bacterium]|nr:TetR family transcriptional regulator [Bryobacteraceae bacterium]
MKVKAKSEETRSRILAAALELFRREGFEAATMRDIASAAEVATGAAYYYFASKDAIVLAFYDQASKDMQPRLEAALLRSKDLKERLAGLLRVKLDYFAPSRGLLGALAAHSDPEHPLSPFSETSRPIRENDIAVFARALHESRTTIPADLQPHLPRLLWLYQMGILLFWIYDRSPGQKRTAALLEQSLTLVVRLIKVANLPLMKPLRKKVLDLIAAATDVEGPAARHQPD